MLFCLYNYINIILSYFVLNQGDSEGFEETLISRPELWPHSGTIGKVDPEHSVNGEDNVDGGQDDAPAERVQPAGDEERPEDGEEAVEDQAQSEEEQGEGAASHGEQGEDDQDEVGDLVVVQMFHSKSETRSEVYLMS